MEDMVNLVKKNSQQLNMYIYHKLKNILEIRLLKK